MTRSFQHRSRRWRPMVERWIAWLVADGCRRVPYRGIERNDLWWSLRVAAVNLRRLLALGLARRDGVWVLARPAPSSGQRTDPAATRSLPSMTAQWAASRAGRTTATVTGPGILSRLLVGLCQVGARACPG
jgi:hypothetical protein